MEANRRKTILLVVVIILLIAWNFLTIPIFLYGSFGSDAILSLSSVGKIVNVLLAAWIFLLIPNFPLFGIFTSLKKEQIKRVYYHLGAFIGVVIGSLFFFQDNNIAALILTEISGLFSFVLLLTQLFSKKNHKSNSSK